MERSAVRESGWVVQPAIYSAFEAPAVSPVGAGCAEGNPPSEVTVKVQGPSEVVCDDGYMMQGE
jgi:hypothetical protein